MHRGRARGNALHHVEPRGVRVDKDALATGPQHSRHGRRRPQEREDGVPCRAACCRAAHTHPHKPTRATPGPASWFSTAVACLVPWACLLGAGSTPLARPAERVVAGHRAQTVRPKERHSNPRAPSPSHTRACARRGPRAPRLARGGRASRGPRKAAGLVLRVVFACEVL